MSVGLSRCPDRRSSHRPAPRRRCPRRATSRPSACRSGSFSGACKACHGHPPKAATVGAPDGIATPPTNATGGSPGAHEMHVTGRGMDCSTCHNGYAVRQMPNSTIDMGFAIDASNYPAFRSVAVSGVYGNTNTLGSATNGQPYVFTGSVDRSGATANQTCGKYLLSWCNTSERLQHESRLDCSRHTGRMRYLPWLYK